MLQDLPLEILVEICLYDFQIGFKLHQTIKKLFLNSDIHKNHFPSENWYRISQDDLTYIRINNELKLHSFDDQPFIVTDINRKKIESEKVETKINGKIWFKFGLVHRDNDQPAYIDDNEQVWWKFGQIHRDNDLPANITANGDKYWFKNYKIHRDNDLPASISADDDKFWYQNGNLHRDNDLPAIIYSNGEKSWYQNSLKHRNGDLPAVITLYGKYWYKNGIKHRDNNLPAVEFNDGGKEWWINGTRCDPEVVSL